MRLRIGEETRGTNDTENQQDLTLLHRILQSTRQNTLFLRGTQNVLQETPGAIEQTSKRNEIRPCALSSHTGMNQKSITEGFFGGWWKCSKIRSWQWVLQLSEYTQHRNKTSQELLKSGRVVASEMEGLLLSRKTQCWLNSPWFFHLVFQATCGNTGEVAGVSTTGIYLVGRPGMLLNILLIKCTGQLPNPQQINDCVLTQLCPTFATPWTY